MTKLRILTLALLAALPGPLRADQSTASAALLHGRIAEATTLLHQQLAANASDGPARLLLCRADLAQDQVDDATQDCQAAAKALPNDSDAYMWLGRALGRKAAHANMVSAYSLAKRVAAAFERAVQLNPNNLPAANDLSEFYVGAPGMVGGGTDKAAQLAARLMPKAPRQAHRILALLAEKNKDLPKAEAEWKAAVAAGSDAAASIDLALFYQKQKRSDESAAAIDQAIAADHRHGPVEVDAASLLGDLNRNPQLAEQCLRAYLASAAQDDSAPVFKVHLQLGRLLARRGDKVAARAEYAAAVALAPNFQPAQKALAAA